MKLWLISQDANRNWDTYDSAVVAAETEDAARMIVPGGHKWNADGEWTLAWLMWASKPEQVKVQYLGEARADIASGVVLASFNAG